MVRSPRPGLLSRFSATQVFFLWKESGVWFVFGTKPFPPMSEAWLSLLRGAAASCWIQDGELGMPVVGLELGLFVQTAPGHQHFPLPSLSRCLYPPVVFPALPGTMWFFSQDGNPWRVTVFPLQAWKGCSVLSIPGEKITQWWNFSL